MHMPEINIPELRASDLFCNDALHFFFTCKLFSFMQFFLRCPRYRTFIKVVQRLFADFPSNCFQQVKGFLSTPDLVLSCNIAILFKSIDCIDIDQLQCCYSKSPHLGPPYIIIIILKCYTKFWINPKNETLTFKNYLSLFQTIIRKPFYHFYIKHLLFENNNYCVFKYFRIISHLNTIINFH